ncbi:hypothetical protein AB0A63_20410 [Lentzea sp. NPDC042327]|uniref:hypothetical protein n=1 Tax=Lentzea sp. NPDC042327 TaxID=3154801 RepID=UPI0033C943A3
MDTKTSSPDCRAPLDHGNPWNSERIIALSLTPGAPIKHLAVFLASGLAFLVVGLLSGTVYWVLGVVMFAIGIIAHHMSPVPAGRSRKGAAPAPRRSSAGRAPGSRPASPRRTASPPSCSPGSGHQARRGVGEGVDEG